MNGPIAVLAGTPVDTRMGVAYLEERGLPGAPFPLSGDPREQTAFQHAPAAEKRRQALAVLRGAMAQGCRRAFVYCNSLSAAVDFPGLAEETGMRIVTPLDVYRRLAPRYRALGVIAANAQGLSGIEKVLLEAEFLDLKANPHRKATGSIIESSLDKGRGYVATVLVSNGTLHVGDIVLAGTNYGKVKAMFNERNQRVKEIGPAEAATILGLNGAPTAGDTFHVMDSEQEAREITNKREQLQREQGLRTQKMLTLDEVGRRIALGGFQELNIIVKGDVDGSIEALSDSLIKLSTEKIAVNVIHKAVGQISESDVALAAASEAIIIGFQVRPSATARKMAEQQGVDIRLYSIIYDAIEEVKSAMEGMLAPEVKEEVTATLEVRQVYHISKVGTVAGAYVMDGKVQRSNKARLIRDGIVVHTGQINALKRFKDDVKEVGTNFECGISLVNYNDIREGDIIETYQEVEVKAKL